MFDPNAPDIPRRSAEEQADKTADAEKAKKTHSPHMDLTGMPVDQLLALRAQVNAALPARSLKDLDLSQELVFQVLALQAAQQKALGDDDTPTNQVAQAMNALSAALTTLVKLQSDVYTSERLKKIEHTLIETLEKLPAEAKEAFLAAYEEGLTPL